MQAGWEPSCVQDIYSYFPPIDEKSEPYGWRLADREEGEVGGCPRTHQTGVPSTCCCHWLLGTSRILVVGWLQGTPMVYCALFPTQIGVMAGPSRYLDLRALSTDAGESILVLILAGPIPSFQVEPRFNQPATSVQMIRLSSCARRGLCIVRC